MRNFSAICAACTERAVDLTVAEISGITAMLTHEIEVAECVPITQLRSHWKVLGQRLIAHLSAQDTKIAALTRAAQPTQPPENRSPTD